MKYSIEYFLKAAEKGDIVQLEACLSTGIDINEKDNDGNSALLWAARMGSSDGVEWLLANGANISDKLRGCDETALIVAMSYGHLNVVRVLIEAGACIDERTTLGETTLYCCLSESKERLSIVRFLIARGADVTMAPTVNASSGVPEAAFGVLAISYLRLAGEATPLAKARKKGNSDAIRLIEYSLSCNADYALYEKLSMDERARLSEDYQSEANLCTVRPKAVTL